MDRNLSRYEPSRQSLVLKAVWRRYAYSEIYVGLKDVLEEAASIVVILRLWRVFKIVEEFSAGASDRQYILIFIQSVPNLGSFDPLATAIEALLILKSAQRWKYLVKR